MDLRIFFKILSEFEKFLKVSYLNITKNLNFFPFLQLRFQKFDDKNRQRDWLWHAWQKSDPSEIHHCHSVGHFRAGSANLQPLHYSTWSRQVAIICSNLWNRFSTAMQAGNKISSRRWGNVTENLSDVPEILRKAWNW